MDVKVSNWLINHIEIRWKERISKSILEIFYIEISNVIAFYISIIASTGREIDK